MTNEEFLRDVCPNHTESSKWNKSELLHILGLHKEQLRLGAVSDTVYDPDWEMIQTAPHGIQYKHKETGETKWE